MTIKPIFYTNSDKLSSIGISESDLDEATNFIYEIFGKGFFEEQESLFLSRNPHSIAQQINQNPIFSWMRTGAVNQIIEFLHFCECLKCFINEPRIKDLYIPRLKQKGSLANSAIFELRIAKRFLDLGAHVEVEKELIDEYPPIDIITSKDGVNFCIECKSKEHPVHVEDFENLLLQAVQKIPLPEGTGIKLDLNSKIENDTQYRKIKSCITKKIAPCIKNIPVSKTLIQVDCDYGKIGIIRFPLTHWELVWNILVEDTSIIVAKSLVKASKEHPELPQKDLISKTPRTLILTLNYPRDISTESESTANSTKKIIKKAIKQHKRVLDNNMELVIMIDRRFCKGLSSNIKKTIKREFKRPNLTIFSVEFNVDTDSGTVFTNLLPLVKSHKFRTCFQSKYP